MDKEIEISGVEISNAAIKLTEKHYGKSIKIHHGSVTNMPFDNKLYDGILCHALIHLLDETERRKLISNCYSQLKKGSEIFFSVITREVQTFGRGSLISEDRYEQFVGLKI